MLFAVVGSRSVESDNVYHHIRWENAAPAKLPEPQLSEDSKCYDQLVKNKDGTMETRRSGFALGQSVCDVVCL